MATTSRPSVDQLKQALRLTAQIQKLEAQLAAILGNAGTAGTPRAYTKQGKATTRRKPVISPEGKARIAAAQRLRWAKLKKSKKE